jgi:hypothetical protein
LPVRGGAGLTFWLGQGKIKRKKKGWHLKMQILFPLILMVVGLWWLRKRNFFVIPVCIQNERDITRILALLKKENLITLFTIYCIPRIISATSEPLLLDSFLTQVSSILKNISVKGDTFILKETGKHTGELYAFPTPVKTNYQTTEYYLGGRWLPGSDPRLRNRDLSLQTGPEQREATYQPYNVDHHMITMVDIYRIPHSYHSLRVAAFSGLQKIEVIQKKISKNEARSAIRQFVREDRKKYPSRPQLVEAGHTKKEWVSKSEKEVLESAQTIPRPEIYNTPSGG